MFADRPPTARAVDPIVQALTLTDVVVGATVTAMLLAIAVQAHKRYGSLDPDKLRARRGRARPITVLIPLLAAAGLVGAVAISPRLFVDVVSIVVAAAVTVLCVCCSGRR